MRYDVLDGFRGFFLVFMVVSHVNALVHTTIGKLNHQYLVWINDAAGFVFVSGLVVALVYGRIFDRFGFRAASRATFARMRTIYLYHAALILILLGLAHLPFAENAFYLRHYRAEPVWFTVSSLGLFSASLHMGILPMYIIFMAFLPFVLVALSRGHWPTVLASSFFLWLFGQTRLAALGIDALQARLAAEGIDIWMGMYFNIFSWQLIFFSGSIIGYKISKGNLDLGWLKSPQIRVLAIASLVFLLLLAIWRRAVFGEMLPQDWTAWYMDETLRANLAPISLFSTACFLLLFSWLLVAGGQDRLPVVRLLAGALSWLVRHPALVFLGQHSLQVFSFHILLVYLIHIFLAGRTPGELAGAVILLLSVVSLWIPARLHAMIRRAREGARRPAGA